MTAPHRTPIVRPSVEEFADPLAFTPSGDGASSAEGSADDSTARDGGPERSAQQNRRNALRYRGILLAAGATLFLWAIVGLTLWGALSIFH